MNKKIAFFDEPTDFSLVRGGPYYQVLLRSGLVGKHVDHTLRRILVISLAIWLPLLVLAALSGHALSGPGVPFLYDLSAHVRFLVCTPLLLLGEVINQRRVKPGIQQFLERGLVAPQDQPRFEALIASAMRLRNSRVAEAILFALVLLGGYQLDKRYLAMDVSTWFALPIDGEMQYTLAGYWYRFVSLIIFRFLWLRWYFRLFIWYRFLWQVARHLRLRLNALHPDRAGGLGFLAMSVFAFAPVLIGLSVTIAGFIGTKIWHEGATLPQFKLEIVAWLLFMMLLVLTPLCFFLWQMIEAKALGLREYGLVASLYVTDFRRKWTQGHTTSDELLGAADIQSLADLSNSYAVVQEMRVLPFGRATLLRLTLLLLLPLTPLTLTMFPLDQLLDRAVGMFF